MDQTEALIIETIDRHREEILEFARDIYSHAELGYKEFQTSGKFVKKMEQLGLRTEKGFAITGVKAYLNKDKKEDEIPQVDKDRLKEYNEKIDNMRQQKETLLQEYGKENKIVGQLIDLALLANGLLKGEALNKFVKRSVDLIK